MPLRLLFRLLALFSYSTYNVVLQASVDTHLYNCGVFGGCDSMYPRMSKPQSAMFSREATLEEQHRDKENGEFEGDRIEGPAVDMKGERGLRGDVAFGLYMCKRRQ